MVVVVCVLEFRLLKDSETNYSGLVKHRQHGPEEWEVGGVCSWLFLPTALVVNSEKWNACDAIQEQRPRDKLGL